MHTEPHPEPLTEPRDTGATSRVAQAALAILVAGLIADSGLRWTPMAAAATEAPKVWSDAEQVFVVAAAGSCQFHLEAARLARQRGKDASVLSLAAALGLQHGQAADELRVLLTRLGQPWPDGVPADRRAVLDALAALPGETFDARYVAQVGIADHEADLASYQTAATTLADPGLREWAARMLAAEQQHLSSARALSVRSVARARGLPLGSTAPAVGVH